VTANRNGQAETYHFDKNYQVVETDEPDGSTILSAYDASRNLISQTDENGGTTSYTYDANQNVTSTTTPDGATRRYTYDAQNDLTSVTDGNGNITSYSYDAHGNLVAVNNPDSTHEQFGYDSLGLATSHTDWNGNTTSFAYDSNGYLSTVKYPDGSSVAFTRDVLGHVLSSTNEVGAVTTYSYTPLGQVASVKDALGHTRSFAYTGSGYVKTVTDPNGNVTNYTYDTNKNLTMIQDALGNKRQFSYTAEDQLAGLILPDGSTYSYQYDNRGRLIQTNHYELGIGYNYAYDKHGNLVTKTDPLGNSWNYQYDADNRLVKSTDPAGNATQYEYDPDGNLVQKTDAEGHTSQYGYDAMNRLASFTDALGNTTKYLYDADGNLVQKVDANQKIYAFTYDARNRLISASDPAGDTLRYTYDAASRLVQKTDAQGAVTKYAYDALGRLTQVTDPLGGTVAYAYDPDGNRTSATDQRGNTTSYVYDALNRLVKTVNPYGKAASLAYDAVGRVVARTDALGGTRKYSYDAMGRKLTETNELGKATSYSYDKDGHLLSVTDPLGHVTSYSYDSLGRIVSKTDALGNTRKFAYDALGNLVAATDAKGKTYQYSYDELSRLVAQINKAGAKESYSYDAVGNLVSETDFNGLAAQYQYDGAYRLSGVLYADGKKKSYGYDPDGNLVAATNEIDSLSFSYDLDNRLVGLTDGKLNQSESFAYDPAGNRTSTSWLSGRRTIGYAYGKMNELLAVTDPQRGKTSFAYDDDLRQILEDQPDGVTTKRSYDAAGRITSIVYGEAHGRGSEQLVSRAYLYNDDGQKSYEVDSSGHVTAYAYDADGRLSQVEYPFVEDKKSVDFTERLRLGLAPAWGTRGDERLKGVDLPFGLSGFDRSGFAQGLWDRVAKDDGLYRAEQKVDPKAQGGWSIAAGTGATLFAQRLNPDGSTTQALEAAYRSVSLWSRYFDPNEYVWTEKFCYDPNGNRTEKANGWGAIDYSYSDDDRMLSAGKKSYGYDQNGNTTSESLGALTTSYSYSDDNRLTDAYRSVSSDIGRAIGPTIRDGVSYGYDALGRRVERAEYTAMDRDWAKHDEREWKAESDRDYLYDGTSLDPLGVFTDSGFGGPGWMGHGERDGRGEDMAAVSELIRGNGSILERTALADREMGWGRGDAGEVDYYLTDEQGSVTAVTDGYGQARERYAYDAFGETITGELGRGNDIGYDGKVYDPLTKLYNYGYRDYAPRVGRFMTVDPIQAGENWYVYCDNDPVNHVDLLGLIDPDIAFGNLRVKEPGSDNIYAQYHTIGVADPSYVPTDAQIDASLADIKANALQIAVIGGAALLAGPVVDTVGSYSSLSAALIGSGISAGFSLAQSWNTSGTLDTSAYAQAAMAAGFGLVAGPLGETISDTGAGSWIGAGLASAVTGMGSYVASSALFTNSQINFGTMALQGGVSAITGLAGQGIATGLGMIGSYNVSVGTGNYYDPFTGTISPDSSTGLQLMNTQVTSIPEVQTVASSAFGPIGTKALNYGFAAATNQASSSCQ